MQRILIVANRLPVNIEYRRGEISLRASVGGVATGIGSYHESGNSVWVGWADAPAARLDAARREEIRSRLAEEHHCHPVFLTVDDVNHYYQGFSNKTLWPLFHQFTQYATFREDTWAAYDRVNRKFCDAVLEVARPDDMIWVHDYQLMLLPAMLRAKLPVASIGFFLHIPFPAYEVFRMLPWRRELLEGVMGSDLVGFHTYDYARHFLGSARRLLGTEDAYGRISYRDRLVVVDAFPMGIDYRRYADSPRERSVKREITKIKKRTGGRKLVLSVDRLDYTKGIPDRLRALDRLLEEHPEWRGKVNFVVVAVPSRARVEHYRNLKCEVDELVGSINGRYSTLDWTPIRYLYRSLPFSQLSALYAVADVALVTPLRDGMNLVAKEYVAACAEDGVGVLILSELAGASEELGEALIVNPNDRRKVVEALVKAFAMSEEEQAARNQAMQQRLKRYTVQRWAEDFLEMLATVKRMQSEHYDRLLTSETEKQLLDSYSAASRRALMLDYDGTLVPITHRPGAAPPDEELLALLERLASDSRNEVVVISGRDRTTLERWLGHLPIDLVAEHGAWLKTDGEWLTIQALSDDWKDRIRPLLEVYTDRTPGSFIEEKDFSLVWHYRMAHPSLGDVRVAELKRTLASMIADLGLMACESKRALEIKSGAVDKGRAAHRWMSRAAPQFILALGDDRTDEDLFEAMPEWAWTIKVGREPSQAAHHVVSVTDVRRLLSRLSEAGSPFGRGENI